MYDPKLREPPVHRQVAGGLEVDRHERLPFGRQSADGLRLGAAAREARKSLTLLTPLAKRARGGALPLRWLVNGKPIDSTPFRRQAEWAPDGKGAARVTVIDGLGRSSSAEVWLK